MNPPNKPAPALTPSIPPQRDGDASYVQAAKDRKRIPLWAMATLSLMPVWAFMYVRAVTESNEVTARPLSVGAEVYANCSSCHGSAGEGASGYQLSEGEVLLTFPRIEDQIRYVYYGSDAFAAADVVIYGNPARPGGPHITGATGAVMPPFGDQLTQSQIIGVVCHERYTLSGAQPTSDEHVAEYDAWCNESAPVYAAVQSGAYDFTSPTAERIDDHQLIPVGPEPVAGLGPATQQK